MRIMATCSKSLTRELVPICNWNKLISTNAFLAVFLDLWNAQFLCKIATREHRKFIIILRAFFLTGDIYKNLGGANFTRRRMSKIATSRKRTRVGIGLNAKARTKFTLTKNPCETVSMTVHGVLKIVLQTKFKKLWKARHFSQIIFKFLWNTLNILSLSWTSPGSICRLVKLHSKEIPTSHKGCRTLLPAHCHASLEWRLIDEPLKEMIQMMEIRNADWDLSKCPAVR